LGGQILTLNGFVNPYSQVKWIFSTKMAQHKALILFKLNSHAKTAPDTVAFYEHPEKPDGIIYPSRLIGHTNLAVFDRATVKLRAVRKTRLIAVAGLAEVLNDLKVSIVEPDP
jgi:hypothetical protein